jgi:hypothetical protein
MALNLPSADAAELGLHAYAEITAHLLHASGRRCHEVLAGLGVSLDRWSPSAATWEEAIEAELARGEHALLIAFAVKLAETRGRLARPSTPPLRATDAEVQSTTRRSPAPAPRLQTAEIDRRALAQPTIPFVRPAALPPPVPDVPIVETTLRLDGASVPRVPPPPLDAPDPAPAFPLTRVKRRVGGPGGLRSWFARLLERLFGWRASP